MEMPVPPELEQARRQVEAAMEQVEKRKVDLDTESWGAIEKVAIKLLGGPFKVDSPQHHLVALGLAAAFGSRLGKEFNAFWFPSRESPEGAAIGFPEALIMLSPFGAVLDAFIAAKLEMLDQLQKDVRASLAQVKFGAQGAGAARLGPADYMRLFDPGFVQLVALDAQKVSAAFDLTPDRLASDLREALARIAQKLPPEAKQQLEAQLVGALSRMDKSKPFKDSVSRAPRVGELVAHLWGSLVSTGSAPEEFWHDAIFPLAFIGAPEKLPPVDPDELEAAKQGVPALLLFLDVVPYTFKAPEEGLLGAFEVDKLSLPHPAFGKTPNLRLVKVSVDSIKEPITKLDLNKTRECLKRFEDQLKQQAGGALPKSAGEVEAGRMLDAASVVLKDVKAVLESGKDVCIRRLTEAEAAAEGMFLEVRNALQGSRIILLS